MLRGKWWEIFHDPELNALEERLDIGNQNIKQAYENFMVARALIREARSQYFPTVSTSPSYNRSAASANLSGSAAARGATGVATFTGQISSLYDLPVDVTWAPDLWGKVRNTVREFQYGAQLSAADLENERLIEQASLAQIYFEIRGQDALQKVLNETVEADKKSLDLAVARYQTGIDTMISVTQAQTTYENVQAQAINIGLARAQFEHAIATLIGKPASSFSIPVKPMTTAPPPIPIGVPSQLLERRPDIAAAERSMAEANAQIGIAYAAYYPTLTLSVAGGFESSTLKAALVVQPLLGDRRDPLGNSLRRRSAACNRQSVRRHLQRGSGRLPANRTHRVPAGRRLSGWSAHSVPGGSQTTASRPLRPNQPDARNGPLSDGHRPISRCSGRANHPAQQPADIGHYPGIGDGRRGPVGHGTRRRVGPVSTSHS